MCASVYVRLCVCIIGYVFSTKDDDFVLSESVLDNVSVRKMDLQKDEITTHSGIF